MTLRDQIELSIGNLWRVKLRSFLTVSGVVIAIAAFVALLSFGAGNQKFVAERYEEFGLFTTMEVYPKKADESDTTQYPPLNTEALDELGSIPGVRAAFPYSSYEVTAQVLDTQVTTQARVLTESGAKTKLFTRIMEGHRFSSDSAREAVVTDELAELIGLENADSLIGQQLIISVQSSSLDSALINVIDDGDGRIFRRFREIRFDSLFNDNYRQRIFRREMSEGLRRFIQGFMNRRITVSDTLTITAVVEQARGRVVSSAPIIVPDKTARRLSSGGMIIGSNPADIIAAMRAGTFFTPEGSEDSREYPKITLDLDPYVPYSNVKDSVESLGFRAFSFAEQFEEIQRFFIFFNMGLGVIGLIALITASLGIVNTMVMSIVERRREIGVLKALGADERHIRRVFLVESGAIGAIGAAAGILVGWIGTRVVSTVAKMIMARQNVPEVELFALPLWLIALSLAFGIGVSMIAGLYPAARAARVDPVEALRGE